MRQKIRIALLVALALSMCAAAALAADVFRFDQKSIELFEGETARIDLIREGTPAEEGTLTYTSGNGKAVSVAADGTMTALNKGQSTVKAVLKTAKRSWSANIAVTVLRAVTNVTLNTNRMQVFQPTDEAISGLLRTETIHDVIVIPAGRSVELQATCTPSDASNRKVSFTSTDEGILKAGNTSARAMQAGECDLIISSVLNPEVQEIYHVLVTQPVTKVTVSSPEGKTVNVGESMTLEAECDPATASIRTVEWKSRNEQIARVDQNGVVTGLKKGSVTIEAKATDGSGKSGTFPVNVAQKVTGITIKESSLLLATNQMGYLHATAQPSDANDKGIVWSSTDPSIATVNSSGQVKGVRRGECSIVATSKSSPEVYAAVPVQIIQRVTDIVFTGGQVSLPIRTTAQLTWEVQPADASIQEVTFSSSNRKVATVDENGLVTGLTRGTSTITATATDGSNRRGQIRVTVTQPVEGVSIQYGVYHVQLDGSLNIKAIIQPSNANNQNVHFVMGDEYIATVKDQKNIGHVRGWHTGNTTITGTTEDGGYSASAEVRVADFNRAIVIDDLYLEGENIRLSLRNRSNFTVDRVYFTVETYDAYNEPLVCNVDGESNSFNGYYRYEIAPYDVSHHYMFDFPDYVQPTAQIGAVVVKITGWRDLEGYTRNIPESEYPTQSYRRFIPTPSGDGMDGMNDGMYGDDGVG